MAGGLDTSIYPRMGPELVAPLVAWMCHEQCSVSGDMLSAMAGRLSRMYLAETPGVYRPSWTIADVDAQMNAIRATTVKDQWILPPVPTGERKSVVEGKSVSVGVDLGGRRTMKKTERQPKP